ncbi:putative membrane protein [Saccharopolyspora lacisalsi]|uniref:Putative membrane protein n=1 Tax=Halosaccharopolyspora lacisalsi TaxID=1000566 RepID=A0A839E2G1_9PSEU|nr:YhgE/Pip domain-containing protein [Halosaccharopolyspora lacisalsi]MBA8825937.1 putative membrane protein [Halosaccharopolyspora lacisalsi]
MTAFRLARTELRRLTAGRLPKLALVAVTLVPLLYGAMYIYANWNPYEQLDSVPAAVVVADQGATRDDGSRFDAGTKVSAELRDSDSFEWHRVDRAEATRGVSAGHYTFALVIPKNFSQALLSPGEFDPRRARLSLITNDANNYLAGTVADKVVEEVRKAVAADAGTRAADRLLLGLSTVHDKTVDAARGADELAGGTDKLAEGIDSAEQGSTKLATGAHRILDAQQKLLDGTTELTEGTERLDQGTARVHDGLRQLRNKTAELPEQTAALADGAAKVAAGNERLADKATEIGELSQRIDGHLDESRQRVAERMRGLGIDEETVNKVLAGLDEANEPITDANGAIQQKVGGLRELADGAPRVAAGAAKLAEATPEMTRGIDELATGSGRAAAGADEAHDGAMRLRDGQQRALEGARALADGADRLENGTTELSQKSGKLVEGSRTLADELRRGAGGIPNPDEPTREATAETIASPVKIDKQAQVSAGTYGAGLAPFFLGIALWVGGFVLFLLMRPLSNRALATGVASWRVAVGGWLPAAIVGLVQAILLHVIVLFGVGVQPASPWWTLAFLALTSFAFTAVVHALNAAFGPKGKFIALVLLVLQLVTAGGTFPWQTIPEPLHPLHQLLPLSYVVDGLRHLLYCGGLESPARAAGVLLCYLVAGLTLSTIAAWRQQVWTPSRLKPELSL